MTYQIPNTAPIACQRGDHTIDQRGDCMSCGYMECEFCGDAWSFDHRCHGTNAQAAEDYERETEVTP